MRRATPPDLDRVAHVEGPYAVARDAVTITTECGCVELAVVLRHDHGAGLPEAASAILAAEADATTRLFAAAPDLLGSLRELVDQVTRGTLRAHYHSSDLRRALNGARAVIATVEGRS